MSRDPSDGPNGTFARRRMYEVTRLPHETVAAIQWFLTKHGISQRELAAVLGVTPSRVSQVLSGDENLTLRTLATLAAAVDAHIEIELVPNDEARSVPGDARRGPNEAPGGSQAEEESAGRLRLRALAGGVRPGPSLARRRYGRSD
jgi:transcriptional regulator with XRE-family HTH domain